ncbi:hypothetical protein EUGRSUZ_K00319 [Eucalyptus grandis]|uniref:Uncharacterized protein n=2 Tax=Eucalyptus grandis TaxID=71139 RepID=A0ACC3IRD2_EUCGR|nr:hypothetical protein EUGRSUZ_K00319 [Eucalyptus grandis]
MILESCHFFLFSHRVGPGGTVWGAVWFLCFAESCSGCCFPIFSFFFSVKEKDNYSPVNYHHNFTQKSQIRVSNHAGRSHSN